MRRRLGQRRGVARDKPEPEARAATRLFAAVDRGNSRWNRVVRRFVPEGCCAGHGRNRVDGFLLRVADGVTIATLGGLSCQWHRLWNVVRVWSLFVPAVLLIVGMALSTNPILLVTRGLDIVGAFLIALGDLYVAPVPPYPPFPPSPPAPPALPPLPPMSPSPPSPPPPLAM